MVRRTALFALLEFGEATREAVAAAGEDRAYCLRDEARSLLRDR